VLTAQTIVLLWRLVNDHLLVPLLSPSIDTGLLKSLIRALTDTLLHRPLDNNGNLPNKAYYIFENVKIENGGVSYYHPADQPPPHDAPTRCVSACSQHLVLRLIGLHKHVSCCDSAGFQMLLYASTARIKPDVLLVRARRSYQWWAYLAHDLEVPITYHAVPAGQPSPLERRAQNATR